MQAVIQYIEKELQGLFPKTEIQGFVRIIAEHVCGINYTQFVLRKNEKIPDSERKEIESIVQRLKSFEPLQYILGETEFYGLKLNVNPSVLIPRPETEELVQWILSYEKNKTPKIIDIGTGSGCIALALKSEIPDSQVFAVDVSEKALETAAENAAKYQLKVEFIHADILHWRSGIWEKYEVIVSNPPYVRELEKARMHSNVLEFEPASALFVSDSDPLIFYREIAKFALQNLKTGGSLYFEINEYLGAEMTGLLSDLGFRNIQIKIDLQGKNRMLRCEI